MLGPLALARLRVVLLPREARLLPAVVHRLDKVLAQPRVEVSSLGLVWAFLKREILKNKFKLVRILLKRKGGDVNIKSRELHLRVVERGPGS